ncbi:MAG: nickel insertion protein, partial [bacterium]
GEILGYTMDRLFAAGALDVFFSAIQMKKNRPGILLQVLCAPGEESACMDIIFRETTTLGVRRTSYTRTVLPRRHENAVTPWGAVRMKITTSNGEERAAPEYEDCRQLAQDNDVPLQQVYLAAQAAYRGGV